MKRQMQQPSRITINKVKISNYDETMDAENQMTGLELGYSEELMDADGGFEFAKEHPNVKLRNFLCHNDLIATFEALRPHMALLCEYADVDDVRGDDLATVDFRKIYVTQITLTGHNENAGVVITGFRLLQDGSKLNLNTPNLKFEVSEYRYSQELSEALDDLTAEAMRALTERRRKVVQAELFDDEDTDDFGDLKDAVQRGEIEIKVQAAR
jgi:CYTH domain-containing protein